MSERARTPHYIKALVKTQTPTVNIAWDVETTSKRKRKHETHTFQCAHVHAWSRPSTGEREVMLDRSFSDPLELWRAVLSITSAHKRVVAWSHGLGYDLRASRALVILPALGAELQAIALARQTSWCSWRGVGNRWQMVDLYSWAPASLDKLAELVGAPPQGALPDESDTVARRERCRADTLIVAATADRVLDWVERERLGTFRPTGAGQSHSAWRARFLTHPPKVHADERLIEYERRAMWTGRCEAWRWGLRAPGRIVEYDLQSAYAQIGRACNVPLALSGRLTRPERALPRVGADGLAVLADVTIRMPVEAVPGALEGRTVWPVGEFRTVLWDPELKLALAHGEIVAWHHAWMYRTAPVLNAALDWIVEQMDPANPATTPLTRLIAKHWSRALIGRLSLRYTEWEDWGEHPKQSATLGLYGERSSGEITRMLHVGHKLMLQGALTESEHSLPQITGWIMSEARRRLWELIQIAGPENVLYMDTDSLIVGGAGAAKLTSAIADGYAYSLIRKRTIRRLEIAGPRLLWVDDERRLAGVPTAARERTRWRYDAHLWRSLPESLARGEADRVRVTDADMHVDFLDGRREQLPDGLTQPLTLEAPDA